MNRPIRESVRKNLIKKAITLLEYEITPKFNGHEKHLTAHKIHKNPNNKYYKMFSRIIDHLIKLRGGYKNTIESLVEDYLTSVYSHYSNNYHRHPHLSNFGPSINNKIHFNEWILENELENNEEYWMSSLPDKHEIIDVYYIFKEELNFIEV